MTITAPVAYAQSNISGDLAGTVADSSGAALPNAKVTVTNLDRGDVKVVVSDATGGFRVPLLIPGKYKVSAVASGFETATTTATVSAGIVTTLTLHLPIGKASTTVEVAGGEIPVLHTEDAQISTAFDMQEIESLPNPGNDLTFVAQTTPGVTMNTQGGYGNFSINGLPGTSNTFTINGGYEGDPYLNVNNSGATNLTLGNNDVDNVTVTANSYDAAFGGLGGAQINEISKAGGNKWHGNAVYWWNGRVLNANSFFNKQSGSPRNFDNANQYAASIGGPLKKDKIFGFLDFEGTRVVIPVRGNAIGPSPNYQAAILAPEGAGDPNYVPKGNLADHGNSSEAALYSTIFNYYNNAPNWSSGSVDPYDANAWDWNGQTTNFAREWLINDRLDWNLSSKDHMFIHSRVDHGVQPTQTSYLDPTFDALSPQPSYDGQLNETHTFSPTLTNQFLFGASYYRAIFTNTNATSLAKTIPFVLIPEGWETGGNWDGYGDASSWVGGVDYAFPQGRNVTGYQFADDVNWIRGKHNLKFGYTFRRDDITDYTSSEHALANAGGENIILDENNFAQGYADEWVERFPTRLSQPVAMYVEGFYVQDQWKPLSNLTLTYGLRVEHNSNPLCVTKCVSNFATDFNSLSTSPATAYNALIASGRKQAYFEQQNIAYEPRVGFSYLPGGNGKTTIRGGFGMFANYFPAQIMGNLVTNVPTVDRFTVLGKYFGASGFPILIDTTSDLSGHAQAVASNDALSSLYSQGACYSGCDPALSLKTITNGVFARPAFTSVAHSIKLPTYEEWSFSIERAFGVNTAVALQYVGNHTYHQPVQRMPNAYDPYGTNASLPASRPNAALGTVTEFYSGGSSNYNGIQATLSSHIRWVSYQFNYAYSHALDDVSNGGFDAFGLNSVGQINPYDLKQNYGNADYDSRHYISANYSVKIPHYGGPKVLVDNWEVSGTVFHNTGYPFSVTDNNGTITYGNPALAMQIDNNFNHHCGGKSHTTAYANPCDFASHFTGSTDFGQQARNQLYGPNYTDFDMDLAKGFNMPKWEAAKLKLAVQFFNLFNHTNFQLPTADVNDPNNGLLSSAASTPTSILGAFLGGDASPRLIQTKLTFTF
ncbi:MAG: carboxypeptidase regulatory-like domain-containing protein [Acidocella sp.]|nr:carboxypeptidase regulatory-like domain-containing protein [Acidocella sp.]